MLIILFKQKLNLLSFKNIHSQMCLYKQASSLTWDMHQLSSNSVTELANVIHTIPIPQVNNKVLKDQRTFHS